MEIVHTAPTYFWNIASILLGLAAIVFTIHSLQVSGCLTCCTLSSGCCGGALLFQLVELQRLASIRDYSAIEDTLRARCLAAGVLLITVLVINLLALYRSTKKCCN